MRVSPRTWATLAAATLAFAGALRPLPAHSQASSPNTFSGRYRLTLSFGPSCPQRGTSVAILFDVQETAAQSSARAATEVGGRPLPADDARVGQFVLLRRGQVLEGPLGVIGHEKILTVEGLGTTFSLMAQGTAESASPAARARGTAFGNLMLSRPGDAENDTLGFCTARDHTWSLERQ